MPDERRWEQVGPIDTMDMGAAGVAIERQINAELRAEVGRLKGEVGRLKGEIERLKGEIERLKDGAAGEFVAFGTRRGKVHLFRSVEAFRQWQVRTKDWRTVGWIDGAEVHGDNE